MGFKPIADWEIKNISFQFATLKGYFVLFILLILSIYTKINSVQLLTVHPVDRLWELGHLR